VAEYDDKPGAMHDAIAERQRSLSKELARMVQLAVETGLLGLVPFIFWLAVLFNRNVRWVRRTRMIFPLVCFLGYLIIIATVSGNDSMSAIFLGLGILATLRTSRPGGLRPRARKPTTRGEVGSHLNML
jgi:hypothetical protein